HTRQRCRSLFPSSGPHHHLHSFPTRRSSDLRPDDLSRNSAGRKILRQRISVRTVEEPRASPDSDSERGHLCGQAGRRRSGISGRSEEHTSELQSRFDLVCRLLLEKKNKKEKM